MMGLFMGLGCGIALVALRNLLDARVRTPEQIRRKGYVPLAEIAPMAKELKEMRRDDRIPGAVKKFDPIVWVAFDPMSMVAEAYRRLRTTLLHLQLERPLKVLLITSPSPSEGKTTTACNVAIALAETNRRVILLDADIRKPRIYKVFGVSAKPGLTDYVVGGAPLEAVIRKNIVEGLDFLSSGSVVPQPSRIFSSQGMFQLLDLVRERYDFMIIDAPPALVVNDAAVLAGVADRVIVVSAAGKTRLAALEKTREIIQAAGGKILGVVLNSFDPRREYGSYYGGYRYGHYGQYRGYYTPEGAPAKRRGPKFLRWARKSGQ